MGVTLARFRFPRSPQLEDNGIGGGWCQEEEWEEDEVGGARG